MSTVKIEHVGAGYNTSEYDRRIEVKLTNGVAFTVFVNDDGSVKLLCDTALGELIEHEVKDAKGRTFNVTSRKVAVESYGVPFGD